MSRSTWLLMAAVVFSVLSCTFAVSLSEREAAKSKEALSAPEMHGGAVADVRGTDSSPEPDVLGVRESDDDGDGDGYEDVQEDTTDDHRREDDETAVDESQPEDDAKAGDDSLDSASEGVPPMQEEHVYFASIDLDHDGVISPSEFARHMKLVEELDIDDSDIDDMYAKNLTLGMTVGKVWIELHGSDTHASAFNEMDINGDSKLTWDEWVHEMFHDQPQEASFVDGEDGDIFTEELMMSFDKNGDRQLDFDEVRAFVGKHMRREDVDADFGGKAQERKDGGKGGIGLTYLFMIEFDQNHDDRVSVDEWNHGFQGQEEEEGEEQQQLPSAGDAASE